MQAQQATPLPDDQFGLAKGSVFDVATPRPFEFKDDAKTARPLVGSGMPVMIPHAVEAHRPITIERNECLRCHTTTGKKVKGAPGVPKNHLGNEEQGKVAIAGRRYQCLQCHAPQTDAKPLVENRSL
jgi:nitrate reductase cytochrome c-type subunit